MSDQNLGGLRYSFQYMADLWGIHGVLAQSKSINFGKITDSGGKNLQTKDKLISIVHYRQSLLREVVAWTAGINLITLPPSMQASLETTLSVVQEQLQSTELQLSDSRSTLSDEKTTLETQIESHKKQLALIQAEFEGEKVNHDNIIMT